LAEAAGARFYGDGVIVLAELAERFDAVGMGCCWPTQHTETQQRQSSVCLNGRRFHAQTLGICGYSGNASIARVLQSGVQLR
jgi:hypothetical protein